MDGSSGLKDGLVDGASGLGENEGSTDGLADGSCELGGSEG